MNRFWTFITDRRVLALIGLLALAAFLFLGARELQLALTWAAVALLVVALLWSGLWLRRRQLARRQARALERALDADAEQATRIRAKYIEAIETGDYDTLKDDVYAR